MQDNRLQLHQASHLWSKGKCHHLAMTTNRNVGLSTIFYQTVLLWILQPKMYHSFKMQLCIKACLWIAFKRLKIHVRGTKQSFVKADKLLAI